MTDRGLGSFFPGALEFGCEILPLVRGELMLGQMLPFVSVAESFEGYLAELFQRSLGLLGLRGVDGDLDGP